jgi:hypothetical protein
VPAGERLAPLLREFDPSVVLLKSTVWERKKTSVQLASMLDAVHTGEAIIADKFDKANNFGDLSRDRFRNCAKRRRKGSTVKPRSHSFKLATAAG